MEAAKNARKFSKAYARNFQFSRKFRLSLAEKFRLKGFRRSNNAGCKIKCFCETEKKLIGFNISKLYKS